MKLKLERPLVFFDIESTGLNRKEDRIVDLALVKLNPDGSRISVEFRVNPGIPISAEAARIHGITDNDVKDCPPFKKVAPDILAFLEGCDLAGYNLIHFDVPMLEEEFRRAGVPFSMTDRFIVDAQKIFHRREPRDLSAALAFYCNREHVDAHGAMPDVEATVDVLEGQCAMYDDLPDTVAQLAEYCTPKDADVLDREGKLKWLKGEVVINFGQNKGKLLRELALANPQYLNWILRKDFPRDMQDIVRDALEGKFPEPPTIKR
jgi:DNA polymerase-3 subunit epsilon